MKNVCRFAMVCALMLCFSTVARAFETSDYGNISVSYYTQGETFPFASPYVAQESFSADQKSAVSRACNYLGNLFSNVAARDVNIHFMWADLDDGILGGSASATWYDPDDTWQATGTQMVWMYGLYVGAANEIDCIITYNPDYNWYTGTATSGFGGYDLQTVVTHEITHALGFYSSYDSDFDVFPQYLSEWDTHLADSADNIPESNGDGIPENFEATAYEGNKVKWTGENANDAYHEMPGVDDNAIVRIYAPDPYEGGSSLSHIDRNGWDGIYGTADDLVGMMNYSIDEGVAYREYNSVELGVLQDLGWEVVPEPLTAAILIVGAALIKKRRS